MKDFAKNLPGDIVSKYTWDRPSVPIGPIVVAKSYSEVQRLFAEPTLFTSEVGQRLGYLTGGARLNIPPVSSSPMCHRLVQLAFLKVENVLTSNSQLEEATRAISRITEDLIKQKKLRVVGVGSRSVYLDVVRDVINLVPVYWLSNNIVS
jgi:hypothetical protein